MKFRKELSKQNPQRVRARTKVLLNKDIRKRRRSYFQNDFYKILAIISLWCFICYLYCEFWEKQYCNQRVMKFDYTPPTKMLFRNLTYFIQESNRKTTSYKRHFQQVLTGHQYVDSKEHGDIIFDIENKQPCMEDGKIHRTSSKCGRNCLKKSCIHEYASGIIRNQRGCGNNLVFKTYSMQDPHECQDFFKNAREQAKWLLKPLKHRSGRGISLINDVEEFKLKYESCRGNEKMVVQEFLSNPFLWNGFKFDYRFYVLVARTNPLMIFVAPYFSYFRIAGMPYNETNMESYVTNYSQCKKLNSITNCLRYENEFFPYLKSVGMNQDVWDVSVTKMSRMALEMTHAVFETRPIYVSNRFTWFGFDFLFDEQLEPYFLEMNGQPGHGGMAHPIYAAKNAQFYQNIFDLVYIAQKLKPPNDELKDIAEKMKFLLVQQRESCDTYNGCSLWQIF